MGLEGLTDPTDISDDELGEILQRLSPKAKAELARRIESRMSQERKVWFCDRERSCDGKPHGVYNYRHARGDQWPPPGTSWLVWLLRGGRGSGKTRTGSEYTRYISKKIPFLALVGPTGPAVRTVMIEGESGLIRACEAAGEYTPGMYEPSKQRFTFASGARAQLFSAEEPARIRGNQFGFMWADEPAHWEDPQDVWDMAMFALRLGRRPHVLATTTPLPSDWMKQLVAQDDTVSVGVSTYKNIDNLAETVVRTILKKYEGTYLGRQEIHGEIVDDREGALWNSEQFLYIDPDTRQFDRILVGIDPAGSQGKRSDLTGIIVGGRMGEAIVALDDLSGKYSPSAWARAAIGAYHKYKADAIVVERNYGGDMCRATLKAEGFTGRIIEAKATDGKRLRAEPIAAKYEKVQHGLDPEAFHARNGKLTKLESEMVSWIPGQGKSPNRVDAWVWVATALEKGVGRATISSSPTTRITPPGYQGPGSKWSKNQARRGRGFRR